MTVFLNRFYKKIKGYINTYRLQLIYIVEVITKYKLAVNIINYVGIYSMIKSDSKASPKVDNVNNAEKMAKPLAAE